jgi:hypothetical protein
MLLPKRFPWLPVMAVAAFSGALLLCNWLVWTPIQRYYLPTYLKCDFFGTDAAARVEVGWLYKTGPRRKQELALDADVVPASSGSGKFIPMQLSAAARQAGWTSLIEGPEEWHQTAKLQPFLQAQFYAGENIRKVLLTPFLCGVALLLFMLAVLDLLQSWIKCRRWKSQRIEWDEPRSSWLWRWRMKMSKIRLKLPKFTKPRTPESVSRPTPPVPADVPLESAKKPPQVALPLFGATGSDSKEGFAWSKAKEID